MKKVKGFLPTMEGSHSEVKIDLAIKVGFSNNLASLSFDFDVTNFARTKNKAKRNKRHSLSSANVGGTRLNQSDDL